MDQSNESSAQRTPLWLDELNPSTEGEGFLKTGIRHSLVFVKRQSDRLLVTFDNLSNVDDDSLHRDPWAFKFARDEGLCHLGIMAHVKDWYRDAGLIEQFRELAERGFFNGYERVVFAGVSMGAYGALTYASFAPGAHVLAFNPQTTLDPDIVPWETRYKFGQRQDWTLPLADAAETISGHGQVNLFYDPYHSVDPLHAARLTGDNVRTFKCWHSSHKSALFLKNANLLKPVMTQAIFDDLTEQDFYRIYRARKNINWYRRSISRYLMENRHEQLLDAFEERFARHMAELERLKAVDASVLQAPEAAEEYEAENAGGLSVEAVEETRRDVSQLIKTASKTASLNRRTPKRLGGASAQNCVAVTTMKNEGPFMLEWVAFNRVIGFSDFLIYTNDCDDGTDRIAMRLEEMGLAKHRKNAFKQGGRPQRAALKAARSEAAYKAADWLMCLDCDEFLNVRVGEGHLDDLFAAIGHADAVSTCWKLFGNSGHVAYRDDFMIDQFVHCCEEGKFPNYRARGLKTLVRNNDRLKKLKIHCPEFNGDESSVTWVDGGGQPMPASYFQKGWKAADTFAHDLVRLHHYAVRSVESFLVKRDRGRVNHTAEDQGITYWKNMNYNLAKDESLRPLVPALRAEVDKLLQDAELARLHMAACDWHRAKIAELRARDGWTAFCAEIADIGAVEAPALQKAS